MATLCWRCANACGNCEWSDGSFTPVKGWDATETLLIGDRGISRPKRMQSFIVRKCPKFKDDREQYRSSKEERKWY